MRYRQRLFGAVLTSLLAGTACSPPPLPPAELHTDAAPNAARSAAKGPYLYVAGEALSEYAVGSSKPLRTAKPAHQVTALALDRFGNLFVREIYGSLAGEIQVFNAFDLRLKRTIKNPPLLASAMVTDADGYLYVASDVGVWVYPPGGDRAADRLRPQWGIEALEFDAFSNLYAGAGSRVGIFAPTYVAGHLKFERAVRKGIHFLDTLALAPSGDLFAANCYSCIYSSPPHPDSVTVYAQGGSTPLLHVRDGISGPQALAIDAGTELYVANEPSPSGSSTPGWISVYASGSVRPARRITNHVDGPVALALDPAQKLYVANARSSSVSVYGPGGAKFLYRITKGIRGAAAMLIGSP